MINAVKQAAEFGLTRRGQRVAALLMFISDVHALGLDAAQGSVCSETFYWDLNDRTRAFSSRMPPPCITSRRWRTWERQRRNWTVRRQCCA
jgi:branched-chain amino acid transport system substrate-binding protein